MKPESWRSIFFKAILAGILIAIGGIVYLSVENKYLGAFLFSLGLFTILRYRFALYTGKVGYIPEKQPVYLREVGITFLGNAVGTGAVALLLRFARTGEALHAAARASAAVKTGDSPVSSLILGIFCGLLMYVAVDNGNRCREEKREASFLFGTCMPVMVFILCGFNHSVADCFYLFAAVEHPSEIPAGILYILLVAAGNAIGGMLIPLVSKGFDK